MNFIKYQAFIKAVELGSMSKAAEELGYSQPGISHMISSLEKELGFPLLIRKKDTLIPTENGRKILYYCYQIVKNENGLIDTAASINGLLTGEIRIGALNSMLVDFVPKVAAIFSDTYPGISMQLMENTYSGLSDQLRQGRLDVAFINDMVSKEFEFYPLFDDPVCVIMPAGHPLISQEKIPVSALNGCNFILPMPGWDDLYDIVIRKQPFSPQIRHRVASDTAAISMVSDGMGFYMLSRQQTALLPHTVEARELQGDFHRRLGICVKSLKHATPATREFIHHARKYAGDHGDCGDRRRD